MPSAKALLDAYGLHPKRSFGQNFLADPQLLGRLAALCGEPASVVEIGAGLGHFTRALLEQEHTVSAIERDRDLIPVLHAELGAWEQAGKLRIIEGDAKQVDYRALFDAQCGEPPAPDARAPADAPITASRCIRPRVLVGNLPYQLTGPLLRRIAELGPELHRAVLLVQLEVAERLTAASGGKTYGALSIFTQAVFYTKRQLIIRSGAFYPQPRVDSAVVTLTPRSPLPGALSPHFGQLVHAAFQQRRKRLGNALARLPAVGTHGQRGLEQAAAQAGVDLNARGETLSVESFAKFAACLDAL